MDDNSEDVQPGHKRMDLWRLSSVGPDVSHTAHMSLDNKNLGRLVHIADPRTIWTSESGDFTPWLAQNIDVLADALGMTHRDRHRGPSRRLPPRHPR